MAGVASVSVSPVVWRRRRSIRQSRRSGGRRSPTCYVGGPLEPAGIAAAIRSWLDSA